MLQFIFHFIQLLSWVCVCRCVLICCVPFRLCLVFAAFSLFFFQSSTDKVVEAALMLTEMINQVSISYRFRFIYFFFTSLSLLDFYRNCSFRSYFYDVSIMRSRSMFLFCDLFFCFVHWFFGNCFSSIMDLIFPNNFIITAFGRREERMKNNNWMTFYYLFLRSLQLEPYFFLSCSFGFLK